MSTEITAPPFLITWSVDPKCPTMTRYSLTIPNAPGEKPKPRKWRDYVEYLTPRDASLAAKALGKAQFVPLGTATKGGRGDLS